MRMRNHRGLLGAAGVSIVVSLCALPALAGWAPRGVAVVTVVAADQDAASWVPAHPLAAMRLIEPDKHAATFREYLSSSGFYESPAYQLIGSNPGLVQAQIGLLGVAAASGTDGWTAVGRMLGRDAVVALYPGDGAGSQSKVVMVALARDAAGRQKFIDSAATAAGLMKGGKPDPEKSSTVEDRTVFTLGELCYCVDGDALVLASTPELIGTALRTHRGKGESLAGSGELEAVRKAAPADAMAWATVDAQTIVKGAAADGKDTTGLVENPLGGFLFGGWVKSMLDARSAVAWVRDVTDGLSLTARVERQGALPRSHGGFEVKFPSVAVDWDAVTLPRQIMSLSVSRGWADLFSEREGILTLPGAAQATAFATTLTTLMGGMDFMEDFLPRVNGPVRLLLERQEFAGSGFEPTPKLPGFALVAPVKGGSEDMVRQRLMSSSQMAMSFISLDAAQKQQPGLIMGMGEYRGVTMIKGTYAPPGAAAAMRGGAGGGTPKDEMKDQAAPGAGTVGKGVNVRYNFEPVVAVVKDHYIVATSVPMLRSLIDAALDSTSASAASAGLAGDAVRIAGAETTRILESNREELVVQRMLEKDEDRAQAERVVDALVALSGMVEGLTVESRPTSTGMEATLTLAMKPHAVGAGGTGAGK